MKFKNSGKISYVFLRIAAKLSEIDKMTRYYGTDQPLFFAEIHMLKSIRENEGIHITGLADMLGVTKGAVSQIVMKLERKGMIIKDVDPGNSSKLLLTLTPKGRVAYLNHEKLHRAFDNLFYAALQDVTEENKIFLNDFLDSVDRKIDACDKIERPGS